MNSVPGGRSTSITWPRAWHTSRCSAIVPRRRPHARRASAEARARGQHGDVEHPVLRVGGADLRAAAEGAGDRHDRLPGLTGEDLGAVRAHRAPQRVLGHRRADRADRVGERAELRLQRPGAVRRGRGEPGARDVDERPPAGEAPELERPQRAARWPPARTPRSGSSGSSDARAKSLAVPAGITASGTARRPASSAQGADACRRRRPPRSAPAPSRRSLSRSSGPYTLTSAPWRRIVAASDSGSRPPPEASLAISAMRTRTGGYRRRAFRLRAMFGRIDHVGLAVSDLEEAIDLHVNVYGLALVHRETVSEQGVEAALLDVGENHIELLAPLHEDTPVGRFLAKPRPRPAPRGLPGGGHRGHAADPARRRAAADRRDAANRHPPLAGRLPPPVRLGRGPDRDRPTC